MNLTELYNDNKDVEVIYWPWRRSQQQVQNYFLLHARRRCHWVLMSDVDEYVALRPPGPWRNAMKQKSGYLKRFLKTSVFNKTSQIILNSITMGPSGHLLRPAGPPSESFLFKKRGDPNTTKPIVYVSHSYPATEVHTVRMPKKSRYMYASLGEHESESNYTIGLVHYKFRSWEEHVRKGQGDRSSIAMNTWNNAVNWRVHNPNKEYLQYKPEDRFDKFRDIWRHVRKMKVPPAIVLSGDELFLENR